MNKDNIVAEIRETEGIVSEEPILSLSITFGSLPIGMSEIESWISARQASKYNAHLQRLMVSLGCNTKEGFIATTHAASINDTFWVKRDDEAVEWKDVSLYANQFTDTISKLAFEGVGLAAETFSSTQKQSSAILSNQKLMLKDVFFSAQAERALEEARERKIHETIVAGFVDLVQDIADQYGLIAGPGDTESGLTCILENQSMSLIVDFEHGKIEVENNGHIVNLGAVSAEDGDIIPIYNAVLQKFCEYAGRTEMQEYPAPQYSPAREERERYFDDFER